MRRENNNGVINRKILLLGILTISLGVCQRATSYTMARVENSIGLIISSSENALVAVKDKFGISATKRLKEVSKKTTTICRVLGMEIEDSGENEIKDVQPNDKLEILEEKIVDIEVTKEHLLEGIDYNGSCLTITNNMDKVLDINIAIDGLAILKGQGVTIEANSAILRPGERWEVQYTINEDTEPIFMEKLVNLTINATWDGGSATIVEEINISINTETIYEEKEEIVLQEIIKTESTNETQELIKEDTIESNEEIQESFG